MMVKLINTFQLKFYFTHALRDLFRSYKNIISIIITLFLSLFILSIIFTTKDNIEKSLTKNAQTLLGGDVEIDYNKTKGNINLLNKNMKKTVLISPPIKPAYVLLGLIDGAIFLPPIHLPNIYEKESFTETPANNINVK